jgi:endonuclease YncB( thermonuclease family)
MKRFLPILAILLAVGSASAADIIMTGPPSAVRPVATIELPTYQGRVSVIDGRTLWYPQLAQRVRLVDIDACELPQWALDPTWTDRRQVRSPAPVPCGPLAKAWLKRAIGGHPTTCRAVAYDTQGIPLAYCSARGYDLGLEMLRVGWARVDNLYPAHPNYLRYQDAAIAARYGMWGTYVLDMNEWRRKAVDRTLDRQPIADFTLLAERESEISPPFADARNRPQRTDR